jgi:hypothetical protein
LKEPLHKNFPKINQVLGKAQYTRFFYTGQGRNLKNKAPEAPQKWYCSKIPVSGQIPTKTENEPRLFSGISAFQW